MPSFLFFGDDETSRPAARTQAARNRKKKHALQVIQRKPAHRKTLREGLAKLSASSNRSYRCSKGGRSAFYMPSRRGRWKARLLLPDDREESARSTYVFLNSPAHARTHGCGHRRMATRFRLLWCVFRGYAAVWHSSRSQSPFNVCSRRSREVRVLSCSERSAVFGPDKQRPQKFRKHRWSVIR